MYKFKHVSTAIIVFLLGVSVLIIGPGMIASEEGTDTGLNSLSFKINGDHMGEPAVYQYWFDHVNTENEVFRMTTTSKDEDTVLLEWIVIKGEKAFYKDSENTGGTWQTIPYSESLWTRIRDAVLSGTGVDFWLGIEGKKEYIITRGEEGEEEEVKLYDISVNEPIEESTFQPE